MTNTKSGRTLSSALLAQLSACTLSLLALAATPADTLRLHPKNPHYFLWRGEPTILITSGEHYGAVLNLDFDYRRYLRTLNAAGLNMTRMFVGGTYVEPKGAFNIERNTLAPAAHRYLAPWQRSSQSGYAGGGNKFDLNTWDESYFERLKDFTHHASLNGVVVEVNLFCPMYEESQWKLSPLNSANNVNGIGNISRTNVYTLDLNAGLLPIQERMVRKIVDELRPFDNVVYEICNEPYFGGVTMAWQHHIADVIREAQGSHRNPKLISQNIANGSLVIDKPHPHVSIFNFHYASPPDAVRQNYLLNKAIGDNETGFKGTADAPYRMEAWDFLLAGGALFNHLDYSFTAGFEDGTFVYPKTQPGGGNPEFRRQLGVLRDFMKSLDFINMTPSRGFLAGGIPAGYTGRTLEKEGSQYAIYLRADPKLKEEECQKLCLTKAKADLQVRLPSGEYLVEWIAPLTGAILKAELIKPEGPTAGLASPEFSGEVAIRINKRSMWQP
jgi:hypothetical protein